MKPYAGIRLAILASVLWLGGCGPARDPVSTPSLPEPTATPAPPTPTLKPVAAWVDGEAIWLEDYEQALTRFEEAKTEAGIDLATLGDYREEVLQALIDRRLLAQGAFAQDIRISADALDEKIETLAQEQEREGQQDFQTWLIQNQFTLEGFKSALEEELLAAEMVAQIVDEVPTVVEQAHARHILVPTREEAQALRAQWEAGADFSELARRHSIDISTQPNGGDLGWFPRDYLLTPAVEEAAFALQAEEVSQVVESDLGFHLVQTVERAEQPLSPDALRELQIQAVEEWLAHRRETVEIEIVITP